ncbi:MAG: clostripain-related cysteine peptidase, partial [Candidatus Cloacimonetes bacterium]|nr:clostripain-related cysteine peptidase [Candidatus Cloacimonadota bacterium]
MLRTKIVIILISLFLPLLLNGENWTILVYMAADNGLCLNAVKDINEMEAAEIDDNLNVIVQVDYSETQPISTARRYKISSDDNPETISSHLISDIGEIDSGSWITLKNFANWGFSNYPSSKKALIIWSHGNSWYKENNDQRWICSDVESNSSISVANGDLRRAFSEMNYRPDMVIFDACNMMTIENITEVHSYCDYVLGSEETV